MIGDWAKQGACVGIGERLGLDLHEVVGAFYPSTVGVAWGRDICEGCPVRCECLSWGLENEEWGVWGNTTADMRRRLRREVSEGTMTLSDVMSVHRCT